MGKSRTTKRNSASASPYHRKVPSQPVRNNIFKLNTKIGQHVLKNPGIADAIVEKANIQPGDTVLEVGPGSGVLTTRILDKARNVVAVELDPRMAAELTRRVQETPAQQRLRIILGDFIKVDPAELPSFNVCISNTPYQISSPLVFKLLSLPRPPRVSILMVQREFALRLLARPGDAMYSRLSVNAQFFARVSHIMKVGKNNFKPPPKVESSVVRLEPRTGRPAISWEEFDGMLRICFVRKNKTLRASWSGSTVRAMLEQNWVTWASIYPDKVKEEDCGFLRGDTEDDLMDGVKLEEDDNASEASGDDKAEDMDVDQNMTIDKMPHLSGATVSVSGIHVPRARIASLIRLKIHRVLDQTGLASQRANKCDETDFLRLLYAFNNEGIRFS